MEPLPALDSFDHDPGQDIHDMGIDPDVPYFHLDLAGEMGVPSPAELAAPASGGEVIMPTFYAPDMSTPALKAADIGADEIECLPEMAPDPQTGDLLQFAQPGGLDIITARGLSSTPDLALPDLEEYDHPAGLEMQAEQEPDPALPDLQQPQLEQDVHMTDRPGDLADDALSEMHDDASYKQLPTDNYKELYTEQRGDNQRRERHEGVRDLGLEREEGSKKRETGRDADEHDYD